MPREHQVSSGHVSPDTRIDFALSSKVSKAVVGTSDIATVYIYIYLCILDLSLLPPPQEALSDFERYEPLNLALGS